MQPIIANCQDGVFAPDQTVEFPEGTWVKLWIVPEPEDADRLNDEDRAFLRELADRQKRVLEPPAE